MCPGPKRSLTLFSVDHRACAKQHIKRARIFTACTIYIYIYIYIYKFSELTQLVAARIVVRQDLYAAVTLFNNKQKQKNTGQQENIGTQVN